MSKLGLEGQAKWGWAFCPSLEGQQAGVPVAFRTIPPAPVYTDTSSWLYWGLNGSPPPRAVRLRGRAVCTRAQQVSHTGPPGWKETVFSSLQSSAASFLPP